MQSSSYWRNNNGGGGLRRKVVKRKKKECSSNQMGCEMVIAPGEVVEVSSNEEGFFGAWYKATILRARRGKGTALVRYDTLLADDPDETGFLEESVDYGFIRPLPPQDGDQKAFEEQDIVDAYDKDGWWKGMVSKVRVLEDDSRIYTVLFKNMNPPEESEYLPSCLRLHMDWVDGKWVRPPKAQRMEGLTFSKGMAVEVNVDKGDGEYSWTPATVLGEVGLSSFLVECNTLIHRDKIGTVEVTVDSSHIRPPPPKLEVKEFELLDKVEAFYSCGWRRGCITHILTQGRYIVLISDVNQEKELSHSCIRPLMKFEEGNWIVFSGSKEMMMEAYLREKIGRVNYANNFNEVILLDGESTEGETTFQHSEQSPSQQSNNCHKKYKRKKAKQCKPDSWPMLHLPKKAKRKSNTKSVSTERLVNSDTCYDTIPLDVPELNCHGEGVSSKSQEGDKHQQKAEDKTTRGGASGLNFEDGASEDVEFPTMKTVEPNGDENIAGNGGRRMEDCTSKQNDAVMGAGGGTEDCTSKEVELPTAIGTECEHNGIECGFNKMGSEGCMTMDIELPTTTIVDPIAEKHVGIGDGAKEMDYEESATEDVESPKKMQVEHVGKENNSAMDFGSCVMEIVGVSKSIRVEHMGSEPIISRCSTREMQFIDCGGTKEDELPVKTSLESAGKDHCRSRGEDTELAEGTGISAGKDIGACEELIMELPEIPETTTFVKYQMLPYVKESSSVWEVVESLQVFRALPQRPHFRPLTECKESVREGLAIGYMVTFSLVAEKIQKLRACDSQEMFDCHMDSLADLEKHGFDTTPLVHRLNKLLSIRDKREKLGHQFKKVQSQIVERSQGQAKLENDIDNMNKKLRELQKEQKEKREELTAMELEAFFTEEEISNADEEFENIAAAGW